MTLKASLAAALALVLCASFGLAQERSSKQQMATKGSQSAKLKKTKKAQALPAGVELLADLEYAEPQGKPLLLDLYRPEQFEGPLPVIVFIHGGGWKQGSKATARKMAWIVPHGFALASINYRLIGEGKWPDQINDCYSAVRWLRENAETYQLDPAHMGCWGTSAGGHLAALLGTRSCPEEETTSSRVQAVCDWFGPSELLTMPPNTLGKGRTEKDIANSNGAKLLGATVRDVPELAKDASALDQVTEDDPPFLIMHGEDDPGVPPAQSEKLHAKLVEAGVPSKLVMIPGAGHGGKEFMTDAVQQEVIHFFESYLKPAHKSQ
ncbi:Carboxylesterase type B [Planctomycetales bacterium 10988]|nr:Carboxylesterase type B [Planctomycetales bacterium 10988]